MSSARRAAGFSPASRVCPASGSLFFHPIFSEQPWLQRKTSKSCNSVGRYLALVIAPCISERPLTSSPLHLDTLLFVKGVPLRISTL